MSYPSGKLSCLPPINWPVGLVPFTYGPKKNGHLFIIDGAVTGAMFPTIDGDAYLYEDYPWKDGKKVSKIDCESLAERNEIKFPALWVSKDVQEQFKKIIAEKNLI